MADFIESGSWQSQSGTVTTKDPITITNNGSCAAPMKVKITGKCVAGIHSGECAQSTEISQTTVAAGLSFGKSTTYQKVMQSLRKLNKNLFSITLYPYTHGGSPTDNVIVAVQRANAAGDPDGVDECSQEIENAWWLANESTNGSKSVVVIFDFRKTPADFEINRSYCIVVRRAGALNDTNYFAIGYASASDVYANGVLKYYNGTSWTVQNYDMGFVVKYKSYGEGFLLKNQRGESLAVSDIWLLTAAYIQALADGLGSYFYEDNFTTDKNDDDKFRLTGTFNKTSDQIELGSGQFLSYLFELAFPLTADAKFTIKPVSGQSYLELYWSPDHINWKLVKKDYSGTSEQEAILYGSKGYNRLYVKINSTGATGIFNKVRLEGNLDINYAGLKNLVKGSNTITPDYNVPSIEFDVLFEWFEFTGLDFGLGPTPAGFYKFDFKNVSVGKARESDLQKVTAGYPRVHLHAVPDLRKVGVEGVDYTSGRVDLHQLESLFGEEKARWFIDKTHMIKCVFLEMPYEIPGGYVSYTPYSLQLIEARQVV